MSNCNTSKLEDFKLRMQEMRIKQTDLVRITGYGRSTVSAWLGKGQPIPSDAIASIAQSMRMTPDEIYSELLGLKPQARKITAEDALRALHEAMKAAERTETSE